MLLPEIALTAQWLKRFEDRFGCTPAAWHSGLTSLERRETWRAIAEGRIGVVVGARSALFLPFADLGLIVVDEEHDTLVQAGRRRLLQRARHGGGARAPGRRRRSC